MTIRPILQYLTALAVAAAAVVLVATAPAAPPLPFLYFFPTTGQSLSVCAFGSPALTTSQPGGYNNFALNVASGDSIIQLGNTLAPLIDQPNIGAECPEFGAGAQFTSMSGGTLQSAWAMTGAGAQPYSNLQRIPSSPTLPITGTANYQHLPTVRDNIITAATGSYSVNYAAVSVTHGETDGSNGVTADQYEADLVQWQADISYDFGKPMLMLADQMSVAMGFGPTNGQWHAAMHHPDQFLTLPKYGTAFTPYAAGDSTGVHMSNAGYRGLGEQIGKAMYRRLIMGQRHTFMAPRSIKRVGTTVTVRLWVPYLPIVVDTTNFPSHSPDYGFQFIDYTSGSPNFISYTGTPTISGDTLTYTLSSLPGGTADYLCYGCFTSNSGGTNNNPSNTGRPGGNIHDSDTAVGILSGNPLYNWELMFIEQLPFSWEDPPSGSQSRILTNGLAH